MYTSRQRPNTAGVHLKVVFTEVQFIELEIRIVLAGDQRGMEMIGWWFLGTERG